MNVSDLDQRRNKILEIVVEEYVDTAAPVGSELISRKLRQNLSPATIRHIMVELEKAGLLEQPHTSAGRIPTDRGLRFYVDSVMQVRHLSPDETRQLEALIKPEEGELVQLLERASQTLADLSQQAAFVVAPTVKHSRVKQIELVPLGLRKLLCVLIANDEMIVSHAVEIEAPLSRDELGALARFINAELVGLPFHDLLDSLERRLLAERDSFYHLVKQSLTILQHALSMEPEDRLFLEGTSYVVAQPEFNKDVRKAHALLKHLESQEELLAYLRQDLAAETVRVRIGHEVPFPGFEGCSYLTAPFSLGGEIVGGVGVLGPKRMNYPRVRALVEGMAHSITELLARWEAGA